MHKLVSNYIRLISKIFHNKPSKNIVQISNLCRRGDLYTTALKDLFSCFVMICYGLLVAMFFFVFIPYLSFVRRLLTKKYIVTTEL